MKKIFTLFAGLLMAAASFAADRRPMVTVDNSRNYKIVIDGRSYFGNNMTFPLDNYYDSRHTIKVYDMRRDFFMRERLISATSFQLGMNDIMIRVDQFGQIDIREMRAYGRYDQNNRGWNNNGRDQRDYNGQGQRDYNGQGQRDYNGQGQRDYNGQGQKDYNGQGQKDYNGQGQKDYNGQGQKDYNGQGQKDYNGQGQRDHNGQGNRGGRGRGF